MTVCMVVLAKDRAFVGADTRGECVDGSHRQTSKLMALAHMPAVVAHSGAHAHGSQLYALCRGYANDFDELLDNMLDLSTLAYRMVRDSIPAEWQKCMTMVAGFSACEGRMVARVYEQQDEVQGFKMLDVKVDGGACSIDPHDERWADKVKLLPAPRGPKSMGQFAHGLVQAIEPFYGGKCGGAFVVAEVGREALIVRPVCDLT